MRDMIPKDGYLIYADTREKVVFYECDPEKNNICPKTMCRGSNPEEESGVGFCAKTVNPAFRKDGSIAWYAVQKTPEEGEPYWGREYIEEV